MKTLKFIAAIVLLTTFIYSCKPDKQAELSKLRKQHDELSDKIKKLEEQGVDSAKVQKSQRVTVLTVKTETFKHFIEVQGKLDGEDNVDVFPESQGIIDDVLVSVGQSVTKGQALAHINKGPARDQLKALETQYKFVQETFDKQQRLWDQKIGSEMQFLQAKTAKEQLESQIAATNKQIDMMTIKSPINGTVEEVNVKVGQIASASIPTPPFRVLNFSILKVKAEVAEAYSHKVSVGDAVQIYFPDLNKEISAKINSASRFISPTSRTFTVEARINPEKDGFKANMIAILKINDYKADNTIMVQVNYIQSDLNGNFVYIAENKGNRTIAKKAPVKQGQSYNGMIEITEGLKVGDTLITSGYLDLENGEAVKF